MLYPYQQETQNATREALRRHKGVLVYAPTGGGKTRIFCNMTADALKKGTKNIWILVHRIELLKATVAALHDLGVPCGQVQPKAKHAPVAPVTVAMVQTLKRRQFDNLAAVNLLIVDEAHLTDFDDQYERFPNAFRLGFSATPKRKGRQRQLTDFFTKMIAKISISQLIREGYLVNCREYHYSVVDVSKIPTKKGDFDENLMYTEFDRNIVYDGAVENWKTICPGVRTLVFCVNIEHAKKMAAEFNAKGIRAKYIVSVAPDDENTGDRDQVLAEWRRGEFDVLVNASIFTTGFDEKTIRCIILARATESENLYFQMIGRGSRPVYPAGMPISTVNDRLAAIKASRKEDFILLDLGENIQRHGQYAMDRKYSLVHYSRAKAGAPMLKECPQCIAYISASCKSCPECGYVYPLTEVEQVEIELKPYRSMEISTVEPDDLVTLDKIRRARGYKHLWCCIQLKMKAPNQADDLIRKYEGLSYPGKKAFKHGWADRMIEMANKQVKRQQDQYAGLAM